MRWCSCAARTPTATMSPRSRAPGDFEESLAAHDAFWQGIAERGDRPELRRGHRRLSSEPERMRVLHGRHRYPARRGEGSGLEPRSRPSDALDHLLDLLAVASPRKATR